MIVVMVLIGRPWNAQYCEWNKDMEAVILICGRGLSRHYVIEVIVMAIIVTLIWEEHASMILATIGCIKQCFRRAGEEEGHPRCDLGSKMWERGRLW